MKHKLSSNHTAEHTQKFRLNGNKRLFRFSCLHDDFIRLERKQADSCDSHRKEIRDWLASESLKN